MAATAADGFRPTYVATLAGAEASQARYADALTLVALLVGLAVVGYLKREALVRWVQRATRPHLDVRPQLYPPRAVRPP